MDVNLDESAPRVLIIEDEDAVGRAMERTLKRLYRVTLVSSIEDGLAALLGSDDIGVVLCDLHMKGTHMQGWDLHATLGQHRPALLPRVIYMYGGVFSDEDERFVEEITGKQATLLKPVLPSELRAAVERCLLAAQS